MKTAEEWAAQIGDVTEPDGAMIYTYAEVRAIQADARKAALTEAAKIAKAHKAKKANVSGLEQEDRDIIRAEERGEEIGGYEISISILSLRDQPPTP